MKSKIGILRGKFLCFYIKYWFYWPIKCVEHKISPKKQNLELINMIVYFLGIEIPTGYNSSYKFISFWSARKKINLNIFCSIFCYVSELECISSEFRNAFGIPLVFCYFVLTPPSTRSCKSVAQALTTGKCPLPAGWQSEHGTTCYHHMPRRAADPELQAPPAQALFQERSQADTSLSPSHNCLQTQSGNPAWMMVPVGGDVTQGQGLVTGTYLVGSNG